MDKYVSAIDLSCNGQLLDDFDTFTENARALREAVELMNKTGVMDLTQRYGFSLGYVVPKNKPEFDFESVEDGTVVVDRGNGRRITFTGCSVLEIGEAKYEGKKVTKEIRFVAGDRVEE